MGDYGRARRVLGRAVGLAEAAGDRELVVRLLITGSLTTMALEGRAAALAELDRARRMATDLASPGLLVRCDVQEAAIHLRCADWAATLRSDAAARPSFTSLQPQEQCALHINAGLAHIGLGDLARGRHELEAAHRVAEQHRLSVPALKAQHNLGWLAYLEGDLPRALTGLRQARDLADEVDEVRVGLDLAEVLAEAGLIDEAERTLRGALAALGGRRSGVDRADILIDLAQCEFIRGDLTSARRHARSAARLHSGHQVAQRAAEAALVVELIDTLRDRAGPPPDLSAGMPRGQLALRVTAERLLQAGRVEQAAAALDAIPRATTLPLGARLHLLYLRARIADLQGQPTVAERAILEGVQRLAAARSGSGSLDIRTALAIHAQRLAQYDVGRAGSQSTERLFVAAERWRAGSMRGSPELAADAELERLLGDLRRRHTALRTGAADPEVVEDTARLEALVSRRSLEVVRTTSATGELTVGSRAIRRAVTEHDVVLVAFHTDGRALERIDVSADGFRRTRLGGVDAAVAAATRLTRDARDLNRLARLPGLGERVLAGTADSAARLDRILLRDLPDGEQVVIVPTQTLFSVPWRMLGSLAQRDLLVSPSATRWVHGQQPNDTSHDTTVAVLGGPGLRHAQPEVRRVRDLWARAGCPATSRAHGAASDLREALAHTTLVHLAAHGRHDDQTPLMSSLLLADGPFVAHSLPHLPTGSGQQQVVLAACAVGQAEVRPGDEPLGFAAALLAKGVATVVAPVTPVDDALAAEVMVTYHRGLVAGLPASTALRRATEGNLQAQSFCLYGNDWRAVGQMKSAGSRKRAS